MRAWIFAVMLVGSPGAAVAASSVLGGGNAKACFDAAQTLRPSSRALAACDAALIGEPLTARDRASTFVNRGILKVVAGDLEGGVADYDEAQAILPDLAEASINRGLARVRQGRLEEARREVEAGVAMGCEQPAPCLYARAVAAEAGGDLRAAYEALRAAVEADPNYAPAAAALPRFTVERGPAAD